MGHHLIEEFCRANQLHPDFIHRCQRVFREEVQAQLDEREKLLEENAALKAENATLKSRPKKGTGDVAAA